MGEAIMKEFRGCSTRPPTPAALGARAKSHTITKLKPKIRIVHIVAPEIIQTDAANFRDLVQRLTGKPARRGGVRKKPAGAAHMGSVKQEAPSFCDLQGYGDAPTPESGERVKVEVEVEVEVEAEELWMGDAPGALFGGLAAADLDGFMQGLGELPLIPLGSSHMDLFGEETSGSE